MGNVVRTLAAVLWGLLLVGLLLAGGLAWRLSRGPIGLPFITARLERMLVAPDRSARVAIGATAIEWDASARSLGIRVRDLRVLGPAGEARAAIPALAVGISPWPLLLGVVSLRSIEAIGTRIHVVREPDGRLEVGIGDAPSAASTQLLVGALLRSTRAHPSTGLASLQGVGLRDGEVVFDDRASGASWRATGVTLAARREAGGLVVERLAFGLDSASVVATGRLRDQTADLELSLARLPTGALARWWPAHVAAAMRQWVLARVSGGGITSARLTLTAALLDGAAPRLTLRSLGGRVSFAGLAVAWLDGMPPVTGVAGTATLAGDAWRIRVARGEMEGIDVVRAVVAPGAAGVRADAVVRAPLSKVLALLERPGLRAAANVPFRPGEISGGVTAHLQADVPPGGGVATVQAHGDLRSVSLRRAYRGRNVNARRLRFELDRREFEMRGEVTVGRTPLQLRWRDALAGAGRGRRVIDVKARLGRDGRAALGVDVGSWLVGPVDARARLAPRPPDATAMTVEVDLTPASLDLPLINVTKDAGAPGWAEARLVLGGGEVAAVDQFALRAAGASVDGRALLGPDEHWRSAEGRVVMPPRSEGGVPATLAVELKPAGTGSQLLVTSDDAGGLLRTIDSFADATGGRLRLTGEIRLAVPGMPLTGTVEAEGFVLTRSPMIAKIAALGAVNGIIAALSGEGLPISQVAASFLQRAGVITVVEAVLASPGMALTARGSIDRPRDELSIDGTLAPNYPNLDRLTRNAPIAPGVFGGEAVPALDFSVTGSLADPYVSATPASALPPSALRELQRLTSGRVRLGRTSRRAAAADATEDEIEPAARRPRRRGAKTSKPGVRPPGETKAKPRVRRRAPVAPSAPETGTE